MRLIFQAGSADVFLVRIGIPEGGNPQVLPAMRRSTAYPLRKGLAQKALESIGSPSLRLPNSEWIRGAMV